MKSILHKKISIEHVKIVIGKKQNQSTAQAFLKRQKLKLYVILTMVQNLSKEDMELLEILKTDEHILSIINKNNLNK